MQCVVNIVGKKYVDYIGNVIFLGGILCDGRRGVSAEGARAVDGA